MWLGMRLSRSQCRIGQLGKFPKWSAWLGLAVGGWGKGCWVRGIKMVRRVTKNDGEMVCKVRVMQLECEFLFEYILFPERDTHCTIKQE